MSYIVKAACGCFAGTHRDKNEDNFFFAKKYLDRGNKGLAAPLVYEIDTSSDSDVVAVFDGMGGEMLGDLASYTAAKTLSACAEVLGEKIVNGKKFLFDFCMAANKAVCGCAEDEKVGCMGTTAAMLFFSQDEVYACNVGDSRIFLLKDSQLLQISEDHTDLKLIQSLGLNKKPQLLQFLGVPESEMEITPFISKGTPRDGDVYVICSDGVTDVIDSVAMYNIITDNSAENAVKEILEAVRTAGGADNATVMVLKTEKSEKR